MKCTNCESTRLIKRGSFFSKTKGVTRQRYECISCRNNFTADANTEIKEIEDLTVSGEVIYLRSEEWINDIMRHDKFVITSAQSNTPSDKKFLRALEEYCRINNAALLIIPIKYKNPTTQLENAEFKFSFEEELEPYLFENNLKLHEKLKVLGAIKIQATAVNPLSGLAPIAKGDSCIIGHNQLQMTTLPIQQCDLPVTLPVIMTTTGTISEKNYSVTKQGYVAEFNHCNSAVVVELDCGIFHLRHLNFDGEGFYDICNYYSGIEGSTVKTVDRPVEAIITGDEHAIFMSKEVLAATFTNDDSIVNTVRPYLIVRHDVLDCYSISHHHNHNVFTQFAKWKSGKNSIEAELNNTIQLIIDTTPPYAETVLVPSNHTDHLTKWLNMADPKREPWNAKLYHYLMYRVLEKTEMGATAASHPDPFKLYSEGIFNANRTKVRFLKRNSSFKLHEIELSHHGDYGANGSKGTRQQFANLPSKTVIGHTHSPGIEKGCYQVGTSSALNLEYNLGTSSWMNTHCLIYKNGKRQLINIIRGRWTSKNKW